MSRSDNNNPLQSGPLSGIPPLPAPPSEPIEIQKGMGIGDLDSEAMELVRQVMSSNVHGTNYAYLVIVLFIAVGLLPLQMGIGDLGNNINANSQFQELMTQFESVFTYLEATPSVPSGGGPAVMPSNWYNTPVGLQKIQQLCQGFQSFYYGTGAQSSSLPTWSNLYLNVRLPDGSYQHIQICDSSGNFVSGVGTIIAAFAKYFSDGGASWNIPGANGHVDPNAKVPGIYMLLLKDIQWKLDQSKQFVNVNDPNQLAEMYGVESSAGGGIDPQAFGTVNSSLAGANDFWTQTLAVPVDYKGNPVEDPKVPHFPYGGAPLISVLLSGDNPDNVPYCALVLGTMATTYWVSQNPNDPTTNKPWANSAGTKGSLCDTLASSAGNAQSSADKDNQSQMTTLQSQSQEITSEVQTGQSIQSTEAKSEAQIVQNQKTS